MKILDKIFGKKTEKPSVDTLVKQEVERVIKSISYGELFSHGMDMSLLNKSVSEPYKNIASVYKAIKALCDNIPQAQLVIYDKKTNEEVEDERLMLLFTNPNARQSQNDFIQEWVGYYALYGEGFIKKISSLANAAGITNLPAQLQILNPSKMTPVKDASTNEVTGWRYGTKEFTLEELVHTKDFNPYDPTRGMSPLLPIDDEIQIDQSTLTFNNAFFRNNATAGLILSTEGNLTTEQKKQLKEALEAKYVGANKSFKTLILEKGLKPADAGAHTHREMEFIEQKQLMREEILGIWRTPKALFNITDDLNYATFMGQMRIFWLYGLMPIMRKFEDSINKNIVSPYNPNLRIGFDYKNTPAFQEGLKEKVEIAQILSQIGFTANEINEKLELGFEETEWRDKWWVGFGQQPVDDSKMEDLMKPPEPAPSDVPPTDGNGKTAKMDIAWETKKAQYLKMFGRTQEYLELKMERKMSRYLMELRSTLLKLSPEQLRNIGQAFDWEQQNKKLNKDMKPLMAEGIDLGVKVAQTVLDRKKSVDDELGHRMNSLLQLRMDKLTGVNGTLKNRLQEKLKDALAQQLQAGGSAEQQVEAMKEAVRELFNLSSSRALLIARTESGGAINSGSHLYYEKEGVTKKRWVTSHDEHVRDSHRECESAGAIPMDSAYPNGCMYPQDQANGDASEVCNCRCSELPVVE